MISTRHVRHDWQTFVDWEQNSVMAACGVKTQRRLAGIPGITYQPTVVEKGGKRVWGWCARCTRGVYFKAKKITSDGDGLNFYTLALYNGVITALEPEYLAITSRQGS